MGEGEEEEGEELAWDHDTPPTLKHLQQHQQRQRHHVVELPLLSLPPPPPLDHQQSRWWPSVARVQPRAHPGSALPVDMEWWDEF